MSTNCPGCNREISSDTRVCPYCRKEQKRKRNNRTHPIWLYLSVLAMLGGILGILITRANHITSDVLVYVFLLITFIGLMGTYFFGFAVRPSSILPEETAASIEIDKEEFKQQDQESQEREQEELRERLKAKELLRKREQAKREIIKALKITPHLEHIAYVGGHETVTTPTSTISSLLVIQEDQLRYFSEMKELFTIPIARIKSMIYDTAEQITLTRTGDLRLSSLEAKANAHYLLIEYIAQSGLAHLLVFRPSKKDEVFFHELNAARNKYASVKVDDH